jgi:surface polysaccharide O-acyltransferase-like enzyme
MKERTKITNRLFYVDNLRIFLISLVVLHHLAITYGGPGSWYYYETEADTISSILYSMFIATNQAFFMGMFFLIAAFFIVPSLKRKGILPFLKDRFLRLGIPLVVFYFLLSPFSVFLLARFVNGETISFWDFLVQGMGRGFGPMWFVEALLIFTIVYVGIRSIFGNRNIERRKLIPFPSTITIILFALVIGLGCFTIRIWLPVGWAMPFTDFQFPHFLQYICLFVIGIVAYQNKWLDRIEYKSSLRWFAFVQFMIFIVFLLLFYFGGAADGDIDQFMGGLHWQAITYAIWEQIVAVSMIIALFGIFKKKFNNQEMLAKTLSTSAFGVFILHTPILIAISVIFRFWEIYPLLKFIVLSPLALIGCFFLASLIRKLPLANKIL